MSRAFGTLNSTDPKWLKDMAEKSPPCYERKTWVIYLQGVHAESVDNNPLRMSLYRGVVPNFCEGCQSSHQQAMLKARKCKPPADLKPTAKAKAKGRRARSARPVTPVVSFNVVTWAVAVYADLGNVTRNGFKPAAVEVAIHSGRPHKGHLWKLATDFTKTAASVPRTSSTTSAMAAMAAITQFATDPQLSLELARSSLGEDA
jgi:hypothetical protein